MNLLSLSIPLLITFSHFLISSENTFKPANDGRDRYEEGYDHSPQLTLFHAPSHEYEGYQVSTGGLFDANSQPLGAGQFQWARDYVINTIRVIAADVYRQLGKSPIPTTIFDTTRENGDTPVMLHEDAPPQGRHPGSSHDGGNNIDISYYLTSTNGIHNQEDWAACTNHFIKNDAGELKDNYQCSDTPDRLSVTHQTLFFALLLNLDQQFSGNLIQVVGIDEFIFNAVLLQLTKWKTLNLHSVTDETIQAFKDKFTYDADSGWAKFHHHHNHIRFHYFHPGYPNGNLYEKTILNLLNNTLSSWVRNQGYRGISFQLSNDGENRLIKLHLNMSPNEHSTIQHVTYVTNGLPTTSKNVHDNFSVTVPWKNISPENGFITTHSDISYFYGNNDMLEKTVAVPNMEPFLDTKIYDHEMSLKVNSVQTSAGTFHVTVSLNCPTTYLPFIRSVKYLFSELSDTLEDSVLTESQSKFETTFTFEKKPNKKINAIIYLADGYSKINL